MDIQNIKDKVKKLLALGTSPNENEARDAMLKARELMMKYKLSEQEFETKPDAKMVSKTCDEIKWSTDSGRVWMARLCELIADNYLCVSAWKTPRGTRTHTLVITGMEDDVEVCREVIKYAVGFVDSTIKALTRHDYADRARVKADSYAKGFILGLEFAFETQQEEHKEWALVVSKPQEVQNYADNLGSRSVHTRKVEFDPLMYAKGQNDGRNFNAQGVLSAT